MGKSCESATSHLPAIHARTPVIPARTPVIPVQLPTTIPIQRNPSLAPASAPAQINQTLEKSDQSHFLRAGAEAGAGLGFLLG